MEPREPCQEPWQEQRLHRGNFRTNNTHLRLTRMLCLETFITGVSRMDYPTGLEPQEPNSSFYRAGSDLPAETQPHIHPDHL